MANFDDEELDTIRIFADILEKVRQKSSELENQKSESEILKKKLEEKTTQIEDQKEIENSLNAEIEEQRKKEDSLNAELEEQRKKEESLNAELEEQRKKEESLTMELQKKSLELKNVTSERDKNCAEMKVTEDSLNKELGEKIDELGGVQWELDDSVKHNQSLVQKEITLTNELETLRVDCIGWEKKFKTLKSESKSEKKLLNKQLDLASDGNKSTTIMLDNLDDIIEVRDKRIEKTLEKCLVDLQKKPAIKKVLNDCHTSIEAEEKILNWGNWAGEQGKKEFMNEWNKSNKIMSKLAMKNKRKRENKRARDSEAKRLKECVKKEVIEGGEEIQAGPAEVEVNLATLDEIVNIAQ